MPKLPWCDWGLMEDDSWLMAFDHLRPGHPVTGVAHRQLKDAVLLQIELVPVHVPLDIATLLGSTQNCLDAVLRQFSEKTCGGAQSRPSQSNMNPMLSTLRGSVSLEDEEEGCTMNTFLERRDERPLGWRCPWRRRTQKGTKLSAAECLNRQDRFSDRVTHAILRAADRRFRWTVVLFEWASPRHQWRVRNRSRRWLGAATRRWGHAPRSRPSPPRAL